MKSIRFRLLAAAISAAMVAAACTSDPLQPRNQAEGARTPRVEIASDTATTSSTATTPTPPPPDTTGRGGHLGGGGG